MNLALTLDDALEEAGQLLSQTTFVIVDLETTGGRTTDSGITEMGAVKVRGGEVLAEFRTFVNPGMPIPPFITVLTGITEQDVVHAPTQGEAIASFLEFSGFDGFARFMPDLQPVYNPIQMHTLTVRRRKNPMARGIGEAVTNDADNKPHGFER